MPLWYNFNPGEVLSAAIVLPLVGSILAVWRIVARLNAKKKLGMADYLVIPAMLFMIGMGIASIYGVSKHAEGYILPVSEEDPAHLTVADQVFWNTEWMQPLALGCIKLSFIFFYRSIFNVGQNTSAFNIVTLASIILITVWTIGFTMSVLLICPGHAAAFWSETSEKAKYCWSTTKFLRAIVWSDVGTDLLVFVLPIPSIMGLHMQTRKKIAVAAIFGLGAITIAASITRAVFFNTLLHAEFHDSEAELETFDPNMIDTNGIYWMLLETGLALIAVNLPPLYGPAGKKGIGSIVRFAQSFGSLRSQRSQPGSRSLASSVHNLNKDGSESGEPGTSIELVPGVHHSNWDSKAMRTESVNQVDDVEAGNINVTKSYTVNRAE